MSANPILYPTQEQLARDTVASALHALTVAAIPPFDQVLWEDVA